MAFFAVVGTELREIGEQLYGPRCQSKLARALQDRGYEVRPIRLSEFIKAGGSAKCLTLRIDGEEAAAWKHDPAAVGVAR